MTFNKSLLPHRRKKRSRRLEPAGLVYLIPLHGGIWHLCVDLNGKLGGNVSLRNSTVRPTPGHLGHVQIHLSRNSRVRKKEQEEEEQSCNGGC